MAEPILLQFQHMRGPASSQAPDEQAFIMPMLKSWEEGRAETRTEGRTEGRAEGQANALLTVLRARGIAVPEAARKRIRTQKDQKQLERWLKKAVVASSIAEVFDDLK